ncbi:MAG: protein kinase [Microscillaceae bacterium]|nr:protein kinase [Microscillaceae bacterium]
MLKGDIIKGYKILKDFTTAGGGLSKWTFAQKNGKEYFMKEFLYPKYPTKNAPGSPETKARKLKACENFERHHKSLMLEINEKCGSGGNLVFTVDFFRSESKYYKVTEKVDVASLSIREISSLPLSSRVLILKTICHSLNVLHKAGIVHGDLKPDNILIKETKTHNYTAKLIDFDNSYFSGNPPEIIEELVGDMVFYSPELAGYIQEDTRIQGKDLTTLSDVFALGLLFCLYLKGSLPEFDQEKYHYACVAVRNGVRLVSAYSDLPPELNALIEKMLISDYTKRPTVAEIFDGLKSLNIQEDEDKTPTHPLNKALLKGGLSSKTKESPLESSEDPPPLTPSQGGLRGKGLNIGKK